MAGGLYSRRIERGEATCPVEKNGNGVRSQHTNAKSVYVPIVRRKKSVRTFLNHYIEGDGDTSVTLFLF
jgi:hypothetical protein